MENYSTIQLLTAISVIATIVSGISAAVAVFYAHRTAKIAKEANNLTKRSFEHEVISSITELREGFNSDVLRIRKDFPKSVEYSLSKCSDKQKNALNAYWEIVFKEYRTFKTGVPEMEKLWDEEFRLEAFRALKWRAFRESLEKLLVHKQKNPRNNDVVEELRQVMSESIKHFQ